MSFVFSRRFYILLALGLLPLSVSWAFPFLAYAVAAYDLLLLVIAIADHFVSRGLASHLDVRREFDGRFALGQETAVTISVDNLSDAAIRLTAKDEYPVEMRTTASADAEMHLEKGFTGSFNYGLVPERRGRYAFGMIVIRYLSKLGLLWCQSQVRTPAEVKVYPNMRKARALELKALGAHSYLATQRRAVRRGEGREFESMRDYVPGDEIRQISWSATARRSKLITRQYQIERDQTVIIALDGGRLMTGKIAGETKFDIAILASLALMSACARAGDNCGSLVFSRKVERYLPPRRGVGHLDAVLESLYDAEPTLVEPSYSRAFQFIARNVKKRAFVVVLTDVIDRESSRELIASLKLLRPRHLPLIVTIGDRDLNSAVGRRPSNSRDIFFQSAAEEVILQRETALKAAESMGSLTLDVTARTLSHKLLQQYLRIKERGLL